MTMLTDEDIGSGSVRFAKDYIGVDYHNEGHSHIDAFSHVAYEGLFYDGMPDTSVTAQGAESGAIDILRGRSGRPRRAARRAAAARRAVARAGRARVRRGPRGGRARAGRPGRARRHPAGAHRPRAPPSPSCRRGTRATRRPGLHPTTASFLAERCVAALGSDGNNDTAPSTTEGVGFPIHVLAINAMGIHLLDYLQFEDLARQCEAEQRWEFLFVAAPLRLRARDGIAAQPDRGLLRRGRRCSTSGSTVLRSALADVGEELERGGAGAARGARAGRCAAGTRCSPPRSARSQPTRCSISCTSHGVAHEDVALARLDEIGPTGPGARRRGPDLGRRARAGQAERPAGGALSRLHDGARA